MTNEENKLIQKKTNNGKSVNCIDCGDCNICTAFIRSPKDNNITVPVNKSIDPCDYLYTILRCKDCGSIFLHPNYFEESFGVYNDERYFTGYFPNNIHSGGGPSLTPPSLSFYTKWRNKRKACLLLKLAGFFRQSNIRVIDIGCAKGELVQAFFDCGCDAYGVDVSGQIVLEAQKKGLNCYHGHFENSPFPNEYFDLIVSIEVFEHIALLETIINKIKQTLKPNGVFIIQVPNDIEGYRHLFFRKIWWMIPPMHIRYFTTKSVKNIFSQYGLKVSFIRTTGSFGDDIGAIISWRLKKLGIRKIQNLLIFKMLIKAMKVLFLPIDILLNVFSRHSEMIVVMRKDNV